jgi:hypothetical protein
MNLKQLKIVNIFYHTMRTAIVEEIAKEDTHEKVRLINVDHSDQAKNLITHTLLAEKIIEPTEDEKIYVCTKDFFDKIKKNCL